MTVGSWQVADTSSDRLTLISWLQWRPRELALYETLGTARLKRGV